MSDTFFPKKLNALCTTLCIDTSIILISIFSAKLSLQGFQWGTVTSGPAWISAPHVKLCTDNHARTAITRTWVERHLHPRIKIA